MIDKTKDLFKKGLEYTHTADLMHHIANILKIVHVENMKDGYSKDAAIDAFCELLQNHKDVSAAPASKESANAPS